MQNGQSRRILEFGINIQQGAVLSPALCALSTTMSTTTTETRPSPPHVTVLSRVASIPLVWSSLETLDQTLSSNAYTRSLYPTAKELSSAAYKYTEPIQIRLAPLIARADNYANKAVDVVEARYPYPFKAKPEEVTEYVRERRQSATELIHHSIDEKVKSPAFHVANEIDHVCLHFFNAMHFHYLTPKHPAICTDCRFPRSCSQPDHEPQ